MSDSQEVVFTYAVEGINKTFAEESMALMRGMYADTAASTDIPMYDFDWKRYKDVFDSGMLMVTVARYDGMMVGFAMYLIVQHPHHKTVRTAECDAIAVNHQLRGNKIGKNLYEFSEDRLREYGVKFVTHRYRVCYGAEPIFPKLGFRLIEHIYMKDL